MKPISTGLTAASIIAILLGGYLSGMENTMDNPASEGYLLWGMALSFGGITTLFIIVMKKLFH